jgi:hypothetical protein
MKGLTRHILRNSDVIQQKTLKIKLLSLSQGKLGGVQRRKVFEFIGTMAILIAFIV